MAGFLPRKIVVNRWALTTISNDCLLATMVGFKHIPGSTIHLIPIFQGISNDLCDCQCAHANDMTVIIVNVGVCVLCNLPLYV